MNGHWPFIVYVQGYNVMYYTFYWSQTIPRKASYFLYAEGSTEIIIKWWGYKLGKLETNQDTEN